MAFFLAFIATNAFAVDVTKVDATAIRLEGKNGEFKIRIDYKTGYEAELGVRKGHILQQRIVRFYDGEEHVGSYFYWQEVGSGLPSATTSGDLLAKPKSFSHVRITDRFYDVNWRDGRWTEDELGQWFTQTWHLFNSSNPEEEGVGYYLCPVEDIPRMDGYLKGCGFTLYAVLEHTFTLSNEN